MTEKTDFKALREAALKATAAEWCTDSQHSVIADAGLNANYYVAACSGPDSKANAKFIALANPATILALLDQLEAERQQREATEKERGELKSAHGNMVVRCALLRQRPDLPVDRIPAYEALVEAQEELAVLRGKQEPVAWMDGGRKPLPEVTVSSVVAKMWKSEGLNPVALFTHPAKPVVVLPELTVGEVMHRSGFDRQYAEGWVSSNDWAINELKLAGFVVKGGE